jgi:hypothetical protein
MADPQFELEREPAAVLAAIPLATEYLATRTELTSLTKLRAEGLSPELARAAVEQAILRQGLDHHWSRDWLFTRDTAEQASHPLVAAFHAGVIHSDGVTEIVDLTAGIGSDCAAIAAVGLNVIAIERDQHTAALLTHNLREFAQARVVVGDSEHVAPKSDAYFVDPARRSGTRSATGARALPERDPERWSPPLSRVRSLSENATVYMKAAPAFEPPHEWARYSISVNRNLVEMFTTNSHDGTYAVMIDTRTGDTTVIEQMPKNTIPEQTLHGDTPVSLGSFIYEVDPAISRSGLTTQVADQLGLRCIGTRGMWLTGEHIPAVPYLRTYRVHDQFPIKEIASRVSHLPGVAIKNKDSQQDFATLRKASRKPDHNSWAVVITTIEGNEVAILVNREIANYPE